MSEVTDGDGRTGARAGVLGVGQFVFFTVFGIAAFDRVGYGILTGLLAGVGAFLYASWEERLSAVREESADVTVSEAVRRADVNVRLAAFGQGLFFGAFAMAGSKAIVPGLNPRFSLATAVSIAGFVAFVWPSFVDLCWTVRRAETPRETASDDPDRNETDERPDSRLRPDNPGRVLGTLIAVFAISLYLSIIGFVLYVWQLSGEYHSFSLLDPPVLLLAGLWSGLAVSLFAYSVWSLWQLRKLPREPARPAGRNPVRKLGYALAVLVSDSDELCAYDRRLRRALWSVVVGGFVLLLPVAVVHGGTG